MPCAHSSCHAHTGVAMRTVDAMRTLDAMCGRGRGPADAKKVWTCCVSHVTRGHRLHAQGHRLHVTCHTGPL